MKKFNSANPGQPRNKLLIIYLSVIILLISLTIFVFIKIQGNYREATIRQRQQQLQTTTNITANNLENFINKYSENLIVIAKDPVIKAKSCDHLSPHLDKGYCPLFNLYSVHQNDVNAIILIDKQGIIKVHFPALKKSEETAAKTCPHNINLESFLHENEVYVSDVFNNKNKQSAIIISAPIYNNDSFSGLVRWMITTAKISAKFTEPITIGDNGYVWMADGHFNILSHHAGGIVGKNTLTICTDILKNNPGKLSSSKFRKYCQESEEFAEKLKKNDEGSGSYIDFSDYKYSLAVFKKISVGNNKWILVTSIPYDEITVPVIKNALKNYMVSGLISLIIILTSMLFYNLQNKKASLEIETKYLSEIAKSAKELEEERHKRLNAVIDGQEIERNRISRELHDGLGQDLLSIKMKLEDLPDNNQSLLWNSIHSIKDSFIKTIYETKRISNDLMPVILDELGIVSAIRNLCDEISKSKKIHIDFVSYGIISDLDNKIQTYLYRICQEGISNIIKHSEAGEANIQLLGNDEQITLIIQDDGKGFSANAETKNHGNGLHNIRDRVSILNGVFDIISTADNGTELIIKIPLKLKKG